MYSSRHRVFGRGVPEVVEAQPSIVASEAKYEIGRPVARLAGWRRFAFTTIASASSACRREAFLDLDVRKAFSSSGAIVLMNAVRRRDRQVDCLAGRAGRSSCSIRMAALTALAAMTATARPSIPGSARRHRWRQRPER